MSGLDRADFMGGSKRADLFAGGPGLCGTDVTLEKTLPSRKTSSSTGACSCVTGDS